MTKDPVRVLLGRRNKRRGSNFESRVRAFLRKYGWYVQRNTFGLYDIVAVPPGELSILDSNKLITLATALHDSYWNRRPLLLQPTTSRYPSKDKIKALKDNDHKWLGDAYLVQPDLKLPRHPLVFTKVKDL